MDRWRGFFLRRYEWVCQCAWRCEETVSQGLQRSFSHSPNPPAFSRHTLSVPQALLLAPANG